MTPEQLSNLINSQPGAATAPSSVHAQLLELARRSLTPIGFVKHAMEIVARHFNSPFSAVYLRLGSETIEHEVHRGPADPSFWRDTVQGYLTESISLGTSRAKLLSARQAELTIGLMSVPLFDSRDAKPGAIAQVVRCDEAGLREKLVRFEALAALISHLMNTTRENRASDDAPKLPTNAISKSAAFESPEELAYSLTNSLRSKLGCEQVVLGLVSGRHVTPVSISGLDDIRHRSPGVVRIRSAMEECLDHGAPVVCQADESWADERLTTGHRLHRQWRDSIGGASVCSIPLRDGNQINAVVSIRRRADEPFTRDQLNQVRAVVEPFGPAFRLLCNARRSLWRHGTDSARQWVATFSRRGHVARKVTATALVLLLGWTVFGTMEYVATVPGRVVPTEARHIVTPIDGRLAAVFVQPGERVVAGQPLCEFGTDELRAQIQMHESQIDVFQTEQARASVADSPVDARMAEASLKLERARLALARQRVENATVRAPIDGIIVSGDPRKRVGGLMARGEALFEIAADANWDIELDTPQMFASYVQSGFSGRFTSHARPEDGISFVVGHVRPSAELRGGHSVFVTDANLRDSPQWIRPGMEGLARVDCGTQPVWWVALHRVIDSMRLNGWL